jgi:ankyrin repeat protein
LDFIFNQIINHTGADVKKTDKEGLTALSWACHQGHRHAVMTLLDKGSSVNAIDKNGRTPLDLAATCSDPKIVQVKQISIIF